MNKAEPEIEIALPAAPSHLSEPARKEWDRVAEEMYHAGIMSNLDRGALAAYCQAYGRWVEAENALRLFAENDKKTRGLVIKTKAGNVIQNPLVGSANKSMADMVRYAAEFGMTPSARSRIVAIKRGEGDDPFSIFD